MANDETARKRKWLKRILLSMVVVPIIVTGTYDVAAYVVACCKQKQVLPLERAFIAPFLETVDAIESPKAKETTEKELEAATDAINNLREQGTDRRKRLLGEKETGK